MRIEDIAQTVAAEWQMGFDGIELDFALEVARRAAAAEREECAIIGARTMESMGSKAGGKIFADGQVIADAIRARSNK